MVESVETTWETTPSSLATSVIFARSPGRRAGPAQKAGKFQSSRVIAARKLLTVPDPLKAPS